jgi:hypothetical protein
VLIERLEFDAVSHCNLSCHGCSHFSPFAVEHFVSLESLEQELRLLGQHARVGRLKIVGGEPLLHPNLLDLVGVVRRLNVARAIEVGTNGLLLGGQPDRFWREVDMVTVSIYPACASKLDLRLFCQKAARHGTGLIFIEKPLFREPAIGIRTEDAALVQRIFDACLMARFCHTLRDGKLFRCSIAPYMDRYLSLFGHAACFAETDGLRVEQTPHMSAHIITYLRSCRPLGACSFCLGSAGRPMPHRLMGRGEAARATSMGSAAELLDRRELQKTLKAFRLWDRLHRFPRPFRHLARAVGAYYLRRALLSSKVRRVVRPKRGLGFRRAPQARL